MSDLHTLPSHRQAIYYTMNLSTPDILPGTLEMLILRAVSLAPMHGYAICQHLRRVSREVLHVPEGSLYPALQRMQLKGWLTSRWMRTPHNRRARIYTITAAGRRQFGEKVTGYENLFAAITRVLRTT